jgi:hypothetical protein
MIAATTNLAIMTSTTEGGTRTMAGDASIMVHLDRNIRAGALIVRLVAAASEDAAEVDTGAEIRDAAIEDHP